ncbi:CCA tRNA nucleotidyltransferase [Priestia koreensis]|uniref:CCA tRNA nucleotidyltransferase n=1 Tax=Priestia koreensis TaxID=284581 RepID=UPI00203EEC56|nr:CCA tRNA nucleotidyltransferase [Priestia koreensis]MCM3003212.1 CCA tRNA nucleotidyltransferase [Priestia koreensis]
MNEPFIRPMTIIETLEQHGHEAYFVGGAVRDVIIGREIGDVDIATSAKPEEVMSLFSKTILVGIEHGTVVVVLDGEQYEVTTFRAEGDYEDFRRPASVQFITSLTADLERRDFTINAIAMNKDGELLDPFNGQQAIKDRIICTVGEARERFTEDALRMMRALRFVSQLGFQLEDRTKEAIKQHKSLLQHVSIERITIEFEKMLSGRFVKQAITLMSETGVHGFLPGLDGAARSLAKVANSHLGELKEQNELWALLLLVLEEAECTAFLKKWKLSNRSIKEIEFAVAAFEAVNRDGWTAQILYTYGLERALNVVRLQRAFGIASLQFNEVKEWYDRLPIHSLKELAVKGTDLMSWTGKKGGPWLSETLQLIEQEVVAGRLQNEQSAIKEWLKCNQQ